MPPALSGPRYFAEHPGFQHSGRISDGSLVKCCACGEMVDCYVHEGPSGDETMGHLLVCPWRPRELIVVVTPLRYPERIPVSIDFGNPPRS